MDARRAELLAAAPGTPAGAGPALAPLETFDGSPEWFRRAFGAALEASARAVESGDSSALARIRRHVGNLRDAAAAWHPMSGTLELEQRLEDVLEYLEGHGHLARTEGVPGLHPANPGLAAALSSHEGPWEKFGGPGPLDDEDTN